MAAFEAIYSAHVRDVYRYAFALTGNAADAEDVTQTTFMNAFRAFRDGERPLKPQNWLLTIAHNVCRQRARGAARRPLEVAYDDDIGVAFVPDTETPSATDIRRALAHLPYLQRATLIMRELEGRSHAEIAEILDITVPAAEMLAFRARRALREHLAGSLTCTEAEAALDQQADGALDHEQIGLLRAHLRECPECERTARRLRAQRQAWRALAAVPVPASLSSFSRTGAAGGAAGVGSALLVKAVVVTVAATTAAGGAYVVKQRLAGRPAPAPVTTVVAQHRPAPQHVPRHAPRHAPAKRPVVGPTTSPTTPAVAPAPAATATEQPQPRPQVTVPPVRKPRVKPVAPPRKNERKRASICAATPREGASPCSKGHSHSPRH